MKKFLSFFILLALFLVPQLAMAQLVPCGNAGQNPCTLIDLFVLMVNIYNYMLLIATPLAILVVLIGGILMLLSGMNAKWYDSGKNMIKWAVISILLIWGAYLIIATLLSVIGFRGGINPPF